MNQFVWLLVLFVFLSGCNPHASSVVKRTNVLTAQDTPFFRLDSSEIPDVSKSTRPIGNEFFVSETEILKDRDLVVWKWKSKPQNPAASERVVFDGEVEGVYVKVLLSRFDGVEGSCGTVEVITRGERKGSATLRAVNGHIVKLESGGFEIRGGITIHVKGNTIDETYVLPLSFQLNPLRNDRGNDSLSE